MPLVAREIRPLVWIIQAWNEEGQYVHVLASLSNKDQVNEALGEIFKVKAYKWSLLEIDPSSLAHKLPGIKKVVTHPVTGNKMQLFSVIIDLNDSRGWTREQIADWIETLDEVPAF